MSGECNAHAFLPKVELQLSRSRQFRKGTEKDAEEEMGVERSFSPEDSVLPSWLFPRASFLSAPASALGFAFTRTTTTSSSGGGGGGGGGGFERLENKSLVSDGKTAGML